jgi:hypothetical protein
VNKKLMKYTSAPAIANAIVGCSRKVSRKHKRL